MLTGDVTWKFNEAQTQEPLEIQALTTICKLLDGSQPKDPLGALFVAQSALRQSQEQQTENKPVAWGYAWECKSVGDWRIEKLGEGCIPPKDTIAIYVIPPAPEGYKP